MRFFVMFVTAVCVLFLMKKDVMAAYRVHGELAKMFRIQHNSLSDNVLYAVSEPQWLFIVNVLHYLFVLAL